MVQRLTTLLTMQPSGSSGLIQRIICSAMGGVLIAWSLMDDGVLSARDSFGFTQAAILGIGAINLLVCLLPISVVSGYLASQFSLVLALGLAEAGLRIALAERYYSPFQADARYLYSLIPNARREYRHAEINGGDSFTYKINSRGFRGPEFSVPKADIYRVVVYGDSFIQAENSREEATLAARLQDQLRTSLGMPVEVINAGVAGYGPDQILKRLEDELEWLEPDYLIVSIYSGNDFGDLVRNKLYRLDQSGRLLENAFQLDPEVARAMAVDKSELMLKKVAKDALSRISLLRVDEDNLDPLNRIDAALEQHRREYLEYVNDFDDVVRELRQDPYSADISLYPYSESAQYKLQLMNAVIASIKRVAAIHDVPLLLLIIPHPMDLLNGRHESGIVDRSLHQHYEPRKLTDSLVEIALQYDVDYVNLFESFQEADVNSLYLRGGDDHWNDAGQALAASRIADRIHPANR